MGFLPGKEFLPPPVNKIPGDIVPFRSGVFADRRSDGDSPLGFKLGPLRGHQPLPNRFIASLKKKETALMLSADAEPRSGQTNEYVRMRAPPLRSTMPSPYFPTKKAQGQNDERRLCFSL
jgi:hypothetical protein